MTQPNATLGRHPVHPRPARQAGFSLIEAVCALLIFATGVLGITRLQSVAVQQTGTAALRTQASLLARNLVATMWLSDRTAATLQSNYDNTSGTPAALAAWVASVNSTLPGASANPPVVRVTPIAGGGATPVSSSNVAIVVSWKAPGDLSVHSYTETARIK